jgi:predicted helicase
MLLAYYIAAINIETTYNTLTSTDSYEPFEGIVLTDTFQLAEDGDPMDAVFFPSNNARADHQKASTSASSSATRPTPSAKPPRTTTTRTSATPPSTSRSPTPTPSVNSHQQELALRLLHPSHPLGIQPHPSFTRRRNHRIRQSNGGWIDGNTADGIRLTLPGEFHHIYIYNLRGNQRTSGEQSRREGGKVFGQGSRNTVAITLLVKQPGPVPAGDAQIHYRDIGDYLTAKPNLTPSPKPLSST